MSPSLPEILQGIVIAMSEPPPPEAAGEFTAGRMGVLAMLSLLGAQEAERGPAANAWENRTLRELCAAQASAYDAALGGALSQAAGVSDGDGSLSAVAAANAELRRALTALHAEAETRGDAELDRRILRLYREMADRRVLHLPTAG